MPTHWAAGRCSRGSPAVFTHVAHLDVENGIQKKAPRASAVTCTARMDRILIKSELQCVYERACAHFNLILILGFLKILTFLFGSAAKRWPDASVFDKLKGGSTIIFHSHEPSAAGSDWERFVTFLPQACSLLPLSWLLLHSLQLLCDRGHTKNYVVWTAFPIKRAFFYIHIRCISSPRAIIHMTTLGAKRIAESLSPAKKQRRCDFFSTVLAVSARGRNIIPF